MTLTEHLAELRMRIIRAGLAVLIGVVIVVLMWDTVLDWLTTPYANLCARRGPESTRSELRTSMLSARTISSRALGSRSSQTRPGDVASPRHSFRGA